MRPRVLPAAQGMAERQDSSVAALNVILSDTSESEYEVVMMIALAEIRIVG